MKVSGIFFTSDGVQITYIEDNDIHTASGVVVQRTIDIPHPVVPQSMFDDLDDSVRQILDHALIVMRAPVDQFRADRP
jgi:hypothetical protein